MPGVANRVIDMSTIAKMVPICGQKRSLVTSIASNISQKTNSNPIKKPLIPENTSTCRNFATNGCFV